MVHALHADTLFLSPPGSGVPQGPPLDDPRRSIPPAPNFRYQGLTANGGGGVFFRPPRQGEKPLLRGSHRQNMRPHHAVLSSLAQFAFHPCEFLAGRACLKAQVEGRCRLVGNQDAQTKKRDFIFADLACDQWIEPSRLS
jgi:hypothetical protein